MNHVKEIGPLRSSADSQLEHDLGVALRLQRLLVEISSCFVTRPVGQVDDTIEESQRIVCQTLGIDRSTLWQFTGDGRELAITHFWQPSGGIPLRRNFVTQGNLPWAEEQVRRGQAFHFSSLADLPPEAARDVEILRVHGTRSNATFPLFANGRVFGALAFGMTHVERRWSVDEISGLKLVAQIFGHVISRRHAEARVEQLRDEIQRSTRASELGEIAAALAHEINQPLTTILGNAQAARRFLDQGNADPAEIRAILDDINLISNAIHAMSETPPDQRRIIVRTRSCAKRVDLLIQDSGCGISPEQLARIFEPFHTTRSEGLGMGLAICRRIAESHGGTLHARNDEAGGAVFTCSVPVR